MRKKRNKRTRPRRDLVIVLLLNAVLIGKVCYELFWAPSTYPPKRPLGALILAVFFCWDTVRRTLRFRELTGHWPDLRKPDLGADDLKKEEKEP